MSLCRARSLVGLRIDLPRDITIIGSGPNDHQIRRKDHTFLLLHTGNNTKIDSSVWQTLLLSSYGFLLICVSLPLCFLWFAQKPTTLNLFESILNHSFLTSLLTVSPSPSLFFCLLLQGKLAMSRPRLAYILAPIQEVLLGLIWLVLWKIVRLFNFVSWKAVESVH
jgi:hypothetical protein